MLKLIKRIKSIDGQTFAEYALILGLISIVSVAALTQWGGHVNNSASHVNNALNTVNITTTT